jgi:hypothetical protein
VEGKTEEKNRARDTKIGLTSGSSLPFAASPPIYMRHHPRYQRHGTPCPQTVRKRGIGCRVSEGGTAPHVLVGRLFLSLKMLQNLLGRRWSEVGKRTEAWLYWLERLYFGGASNGADPPIWHGEPDINSRIPEILGDNQ